MPILALDIRGTAGKAMSDPKMTNKQVLVVVLVPLGILAISVLAYSIVGPPALLFPPVLGTVFLAWLIIELRHFIVGRFVRLTEENRAQFNQVEAMLGLSRFLDPKYPLPATRGWAASPDMLREIVMQVLSDAPQMVLEASSGTSTLALAYALERVGKGRVVALEHDAVYAERTQRMLALHGLQHRATVVHAPLVEHRINGVELLWYDISKATIDLPIDMVVVDGPPDTTRPMARYPAIPVLHSKLAKSSRVLLDDGGRQDERATAELWAKEFKATTIQYLELEKGAWLLRFDR
ncbi:MAG: class I SAM-dependent methyltransferase [Flavobacteriales bacterium]|nr:class I SAM-dependent methyltransferase [Flavobacteriales bacterium]